MSRGIKVKPLILFIVMIICSCSLSSQTPSCFFRDTLFHVNFGNENVQQEFNLRALKNYQRTNSSCPQDGFYSYAPSTSNCFGDDWITLPEDHTRGDAGGKMFLVNASYQPGGFFVATLSGFEVNTTYEFGVWLMNVRKVYGGCKPIHPNIVISLETLSGKKVTAFKTGQIAPAFDPVWRKYFATFTTPADGNALILKMEDVAEGGCGNDFAMDDITFRKCYETEKPIIVKALPPPQAVEPPVAISKPVAKAIKPAERVLKTEKLDVQKKSAPPVSNVEGKVTRVQPIALPVPPILTTRANPVIKQIVTDVAEMQAELYDNGQIDGDTVSIYHNNELIVSKAALTDKPIRFKVKVDKQYPHHELIMVAENLGSIPPNTSLMVLTGNGKRYEIFISSSEQTNAKIIVDLQQ